MHPEEFCRKMGKVIVEVIVEVSAITAFFILIIILFYSSPFNKIPDFVGR